MAQVPSFLGVGGGDLKMMSQDEDIGYNQYWFLEQI